MNTIRLILAGIIWISLYGIILSQPEIVNNPEKGIWQDREESPIFFELVQTFGTDFPDESAVFSRANSITGIQVDSSGNVYVLDNGANLLVKFSPTGKVIWKIDRKGRGPGDLENPLGLAVNNQSVYVANLYGTRIDVFNSGGVYQRSITTKNLNGYGIGMVGTIQDSLLVLKSNIVGKVGSRIIVLNTEKDFMLYSEFLVSEDTEITIPNGKSLGTDVSIIDDQILVTGSFTYEINFFDVSGTLEKRITRDFPAYVRPGFYTSNNKGFILPVGGVYSLLKVEGDYLVNYLTWPVNIENPDGAAERVAKGEFFDLNPKNSLDIYTNKGKLLYSITSNGLYPQIGKLNYTDSEGHLYTLTNTPYTQIRKYKISVDK